MSKKAYITYEEQAHEYEDQAKRLEHFRTQLQQSQNSPSHSPTQLYQQHPSTHTLTHQQQPPLKSNGQLQQYQPQHFLPQKQTGYETQTTTQAQIASAICVSPYTKHLKMGSVAPGKYNGPDYGQPAEQRGIDPMIYPGLYSPSGIDMLSILIRVHQRPNPTFDLGFVDSSCALLLCSLTLQDTPIVYVSDAFTKLTGYSAAEILGQNCRFLQYPPSSPLHPFSSSTAHDSLSDEMKKEEFYKYHDEEDRQEIIKLRESIRSGKEARTVLRNYKKDGEGFANCLTTVPIVWEGNQDGPKRFIVGFQADGNAKRS